MKALAPNTLIQNRYLVVHLIGKGGMGEVYLAVDQRLGSAVALKRTYFAGDEMLGNAFEREARTLARMRHPVLPKVSDHFGEGEEQYLVMEHIAGDDLAKRLEAAQKPFPVSWVMFWADQLLDALSYLHSHEPPIIHRDIKPQNLKLTDENHIILLDFGLSKTSTGQTHISNTGSTGSVVGYTPHYAPMEQIRGIGTNARSDIYSLSATLYQLMTNMIPADALSRADSMLNGLADPIEPPHTINPEIPPAVSDVILKGMEVSQEKRYNNAREMQKALCRAFAQTQEAMAAQTVAFNMGELLPDQPLPASVAETRLMPSQPGVSQPTSDPGAISQTSGSGIDLDETIAYDPTQDLEKLKQAGIKTEIFTQQPETNGQSAPVKPSGELTPVEAEPEHDSFVTKIAAPVAAPMPFAGAGEFPPPPPPQVAAPKKKSSGRAVAIIGGLIAVLVIAAGAAGAGWYLYNNYSSTNAVVGPTPSPEPSVEPTLEPTATPESPVVSEQPTDANSNSTQITTDLPVDEDLPSNSTEPSNRGETGPTKPGATTPRTRPSSTAPKATPQPRTKPGRTDTLQ
jgi:serine/threonine protein kinase